jgi:hypothetical protein
LRISDVRELNRGVQDWLRQSGRLMGMQERLKAASRGRER